MASEEHHVLCHPCSGTAHGKWIPPEQMGYWNMSSRGPWPSHLTLKHSTRASFLPHSFCSFSCLPAVQAFGWTKSILKVRTHRPSTPPRHWVLFRPWRRGQDYINYINLTQKSLFLHRICVHFCLLPHTYTVHLAILHKGILKGMCVGRQQLANGRHWPEMAVLFHIKL